ncbi:replication protein A 70 kDa DNA-binding subunit B-like [Solanum verrucosum]|uniref:replication protein A 70 kDa DNA-binding subunit B-like n=1 Tax=Solanum verrucosum TaxID=315347 RepID=UPI0020D17D53|nr:replication protein A 70 kDa DNA-binding subunit B-like [Solanum verrucosum]
MATETELSKQCVPINKIPKHSVDWVMRVLVIRKGSVISYSNTRHEGTFQTVILVDDEGTKLQATLFNKHIDTWKDFLKTNKTYYIANELLDRVNPNYTSVHKEIELTITDNTIIRESDHVVSTHNFSNGFVSLEQAEKLPNGAIFGNSSYDLLIIFVNYIIQITNLYIRYSDLLCVLVTVNPIIEKGDSKRREIVVTNELMDCTTVTLWGDFALNDGAFLEKLKDDQPILGLCDVRVSIYKGIFGISTLPVSSVLINPIFQKALDLRAWREVIKAEKKAITTTPSKVMRKATEVTLPNIMDGTLADTQGALYKFKAKIIDILNTDEPWYSSCKKCHKKVQVKQHTTTCPNCNIQNVEYEMRYYLRLEVCAGEQRARVILFDAAQMLVGCNVEEYIKTTSENKEECMYYHRLVLIKDKEFNFLVRIDMNNSNPRRSLIAQEIHAIEDEAVIIMSDESKSLTPPTNRGKKSTALERHVLEDKSPIIVEEPQNVRPRRKRSKKSNALHVLEDEAPNIVAEVQSVRLRTKRGKKSNTQQIHVVGEESPNIVEEVRSVMPTTSTSKKINNEHLQIKTKFTKVES